MKICSTCGTQYPANDTRDICAICADDRQYIPESGQVWTTPEALAKEHVVRIAQVAPDVFDFTVVPTFAIGQRALLVGNVLWDCIPLLDEGVKAFIRGRGGIKAIAFSHPHYYSNMNDWAETFDCPIYIHASDAEWIMDKGPRIRLWEGMEQPLWDGMRMVNIGGHFPGSSILQAGDSIFTGDTVALSPSKKFLAVMYSYPNRIPLPLAEVRRIEKRFETLDFENLYGFWSFQNIRGGAKELLMHSLKRYI